MPSFTSFLSRAGFHGVRPSFPLVPRSRFLGVIILGGLAFVSRAADASASPLTLYFSDPIGQTGPRDDCSAPICQALLRRIQAAHQSIDFAIYGLRNQSAILRALVKAQARGVRVRGIVDQDIHGQSYYSSTPQLMKALGTVRSDYSHDIREARNRRPYVGGRGRCPRPAGFLGPLQCLSYDIGDACLQVAHASREPIDYKGDLMHDKFFVFDGRSVWTGSANVSDSGTGGYNANLVALLDSAQVARWYTEEFEQMWSEGRFHRFKSRHGKMFAKLSDGTDVRVYFSPKSRTIPRAVRPLIQGARRSIDIAVFFLTHKDITRDLIHAHQRGVRVRVILDATAAKNGYTKHEILRAAGIPVKIENWGGKMHAKSAVIDGNIVIAGSMNWTSAGTGTNDENTLLIESRVYAAQYQRWFDRLWDSIPLRWLTHRPDPESRDSGFSCTDGVDNDFDDLADNSDPGCSPTPPLLPALPPQKIVPKSEAMRLIKAVVTRGGLKLYYLPGTRQYSSVKIDPTRGGRLFCSVKDAKVAGWTQAGH